jgi:tRNA threonylcarbamoyladenosine biosynthesis protein TsaB
MPRKELILAIETSSRMGSVAIGNRDGCLLVEQAFSGAMRHSAEILPCIEGLLGRLDAAPDDLAQVCLSVGPGSFTGLRIAVTLAKALSLANGVQIVAVDALDVIAFNVPEAKDGAQVIAPILDAKRDQFFVAVYRQQSYPDARLGPACPDQDTTPPGWVKIQADAIMTSRQFMDRFANPSIPVGILGDGLLYHKDKFQADGIQVLDQAWWSPSAAAVYRLGLPKVLAGKFEDPLRLTPIYLLPPEVTVKKR